MPLPITAVCDELPDPRRETANKLHRLTDLLTIATGTVIGGADSGEAIAAYGRTKESFGRRFLPRPNGIPRADPFARVFAPLDPGAFRRAFGRWMAAAGAGTGLVPVASDGKAARQAKPQTATGCRTVVSAWATAHRLTRGPVAVPEGPQEIGVIPELLRTLDRAGARLTIDAAGCPVANARLIRERGVYYRWAVQGDQPALYEAVERVGTQACARDCVGVAMDGRAVVEDGHGRHAERYVTVCTDPEGLPEAWPDVAAVVPVNREREVDGTNPCTTPFSLTSSAGTAAERAGWMRGPWGIGNGWPWVRAGVFREDARRVREGPAGANRALLRRVAVSLLQRAPGQGTTPTKRLKAGWDDDYLLQVLQGITTDIVR